MSEGEVGDLSEVSGTYQALGIKGDSKHSKEEYLQSYVIHEAEKFLTGNGRSMIGWDEILEAVWLRMPR